jgi:hypothetical protein
LRLVSGGSVGWISFAAQIVFARMEVQTMWLLIWDRMAVALLSELKLMLQECAMISMSRYHLSSLVE